MQNRWYRERRDAYTPGFGIFESFRRKWLMIRKFHFRRKDRVSSIFLLIEERTMNFLFLFFIFYWRIQFLVPWSTVALWLFICWFNNEPYVLIDNTERGCLCVQGHVRESEMIPQYENVRISCKKRVSDKFINNGRDS